MSIDVQVMPETASDERMHVLDVDCWCEPIRVGGFVSHVRPAMTEPRDIEDPNDEPAPADDGLGQTMEEPVDPADVDEEDI